MEMCWPNCLLILPLCEPICLLKKALDCRFQNQETFVIVSLDNFLSSATTTEGFLLRVPLLCARFSERSENRETQEL